MIIGRHGVRWVQLIGMLLKCIWVFFITGCPKLPVSYDPIRTPKTVVTITTACTIPCSWIMTIAGCSRGIESMNLMEYESTSS